MLELVTYTVFESTDIKNKLVQMLGSPLAGCWSTERANQRAAQNKYYIESDFGVPGFVLINFFMCNYIFNGLLKIKFLTTLTTLKSYAKGQTTLL